MAIVAITSTGTGELLIKYTESSVEKSLRVLTPLAGLYLDNANTGYKYKILSGTPTAPTGSGISFALITSAYKKLVWSIEFPINNSYIPNNDMSFTSLIVGATTYTFEEPVSFMNTKSAMLISDQIYKLNSPNITPTSYLSENQTKVNNASTVVTIKSSLIINIEDLTGDVYLKLVNSANSVEYLVKGVTEASAVPTGYTATTDPCGVSIPL